MSEVSKAVQDLTVTEIFHDLLQFFHEKYPENVMINGYLVAKVSNEPEAAEKKDAKIVKAKKLDEKELLLQQLLQFGNQSLQSLQLDSKDQRASIKEFIETKYKIRIEDESLYNHVDTTITVIARLIQNHGKTPYQPIWVQTYDLLMEVIKKEGYDNENMFVKSYYTIMDLFKGKKRTKMVNLNDIPNERLPNEWFEKNQLKSNLHSHTFENDIGRQELDLPNDELKGFMFYCLQVFGVFFYLPVITYLLIKFVSWKINLMIVIAFNLYVYFPEYSEFPPLFRRHWGTTMYLKYFSYRCIIESPSEAYVKTPSIYTFGPHGIFGISPAIQALICGYLIGEYFHVLGASAVFLMPLYNMLLKMLGFDDISYQTFKGLLLNKHSVGIIPGGIGEMFYAGSKFQDEVLMVNNRKGFIKIALETGSQIVPTYSFGSTQLFHVGSSKLLQKLSRLLKTSLILFWGPYGLPIPLRIPMVVVVGNPIKCPKVEKPSKELIDQYHKIFLEETQRIYSTYRNTYGWQNRNLVFKG